ncbi:MAG: M16 family metallopeptidase [Bacilli bacterium]
MRVDRYKNIVYITTKNNKFKTSRVSIKFALPISKEIIANAIVLNDLLVMSTEDYETIQKFNEKLYDLYDLSVSSSVSQKGKLHVSELNFSFINSEFLSENIDEEVVEFIESVVFNPNFNNSEYIKAIIEKRILEVKTIYDDKMMYCVKSLQDILDENNECIIDVNSNEEDLGNVSVDSLKEFYKYLLKTSNITIAIDGNNSEEIKNRLLENLDFNNESNSYEFLNNFSSQADFKFISETQALNQSKFAVGIKLDVNKEDFSSFQIFNAIYGGYPFSRLFSNIREKQSLAYTIASAYSPASNVMYIYGGIANGDLSVSDEDHMDSILNALTLELKSICEGNIDNLEMLQAKSMLINSMKSALDIQAGNQSLYYSNYLLGKDFNSEEYENEINSITKEDVVKMAQKVKFDKVFLLRGDK